MHDFNITRSGYPPEMEGPDVPSVWFDRPLPPAANGRFLRALTVLEALVDVSNDPRMWRYLCWIAKLKQNDVDDRVIDWKSICPAAGVAPRLIIGSCDITEGWRGSAGVDDLRKTIKSVSDVGNVNQWPRIITFLKPHIVVFYEMTQLPLENFRLLHDGVQRAIEKLDKWANIGIGGSSAMPASYVSIKDWIGGRQRDPRSVYSCL